MIRSLVVLVGFCLVFFQLQAALPPDFSASDIGTVTLPGNANYDAAAGKLTVNASGADLIGASDQFFFVHHDFTGDGEIVALVGNQTNTNGYCRAGLMLRATLDANSPYVAVFLTPYGGVRFQSRATPGAVTTIDGANNNLPAIWLKLTRIGNRIATFKSTDGHNWDQVGELATFAFPSTARIGVAQTSLNPSVRGAATYTGLALRPTAGGTLPGTTALIGRVGAVGSASVDPAGNVVTLNTNGATIEGPQDDFLYHYQMMNGDGDFVAHLADYDFSTGWATAGIMVRTGNDRAATNFSIMMTPVNGLISRFRPTDGGDNLQKSRVGNLIGPMWFKMTRRSSFYAAFYSFNGTDWIALGDPLAILGAGPIQIGLVVSSQVSTAFVTAHFDQISWPTAAILPPLESDPVVLAGLAAWRKPDPNGISCVDCHTPFAYDIAQFNFNQADVRLATTPHLTPADADAIFAMIEKYRLRYPPVGGLKDFRTFRPMQPGGGAVLGGANAAPDARDLAFGKYLQAHFKLAQGRITTLAQARAAAKELIDVDTKTVPVGLRFNLWSRSVLREGPEAGGEVAEWLPSAGVVPKPQFAAAWFALQDAYIRNPTNDNLWAIYEATTKWVDLDPHNFDAGVRPNWRNIILGQYRANLLLAHDTLLKARGLPSILAAEDGVRPFRDVRKFVTESELSPFWTVGDNARVVQSGGFAGMPRRDRESVFIDPNRTGNVGSEAADQIDDFRLTWFWIGWMQDNSLRFSGEGSTLSGEYFIGSLWTGDSDNSRTGGSDSIHGYRMHQVFFNAVQQFKLGYKPGAWRDNDGTQHFEASKGYYLGYNRWYPPHGDPTDPALAESGPLYKRLLSNHLRMALLIHADEARKLGGVYFNEKFTLDDIYLWRQALAWADPTWSAADEALFADLRASITTTVTPDDVADDNHDGRVNLVAHAIGLPTNAAPVPTAAGFPEHYGVATDGRLTLTFVRAEAGFTYVVESSSDLANWTTIATNPGTVGQSVTVSAPAGGAQTFLRLRIIKALP